MIWRKLIRPHLLAKGLLLVTVLATVVFFQCDSPGNGGGGLFRAAQGKKDRWTICCLRLNVLDHKTICNQYAEMLRRVKELDPRKVRVVSDASSSAVYYGEYTKISDSDSDRLIFPSQYQRDIELIRRLSSGNSTPFFGAQPELLEKGDAPQHPEWSVFSAKGAYTLHIAVFYNTGSFDQRKEAAEQYVAALREAGFSAYYYHGIVKSHVFVGDFLESDIIRSPQGDHWGPRVEEFVSNNEAEFRHTTENGMLRKRLVAEGQYAAPLSVLRKVPKADEASALEQY